MKKRIYFLLAFIWILQNNISAQQLTCGDIFTDSGGIIGRDYNNEQDTTLICPDNPTNSVKIIFSYMNLYWGESLKIYDNDSAIGTPIRNLYGDLNSTPETIIAENETGCLTAVFHNNEDSNDGWLAEINCVARPDCLAPINLTLDDTTHNSATISWTSIGAETQWLITYFKYGNNFLYNTEPEGEIIEVVTSTNPFTLTNLDGFTKYKILIKSLCETSDTSHISVPLLIKTLVIPPDLIPPFICGNLLTDPGGSNGNYPFGDIDDTTVICPTSPTDVVVLNFNYFNATSAADLTIYNGNSTSDPILLSLSGNFQETNPGIFYSTNANGCLTTVFTSFLNYTRKGFEASIECVPIITCIRPTDLIANSITYNSANISWTSQGNESQWVLEYGETGFLPGMGTEVLASTNPYTITNLDAETKYDVYVRAYCGGTDTSFIQNNPLTFQTGILPFICGNLFTDEGGSHGNYYSDENDDDTTIICPSNPTDIVVLKFNDFNVIDVLSSTDDDALTIYNGNSTSAPILGSFTGQNCPGTFYSTHITGCLTAVFHKDNIGSYPSKGWIATIECLPPPSCIRPSNLSVNPSGDSAIVSWTSSGIETQWLVEYGPVGFAQGTGTEILISSNPYTIKGLRGESMYDVHVRAYCGNTDTSFAEGPATFMSGRAPFVCGNEFVDPGGIYGSYPNNANDTNVICPDLPTEAIQLTFNQFALNHGPLLTIYDNDSAVGTLIGTYSVHDEFYNINTIIAENPTGCITTVFHSGNEGWNVHGWRADINCVPKPTCLKPLELIVTDITENAAQISWTSAGTETQWIIEYGETGLYNATDIVTNTNTYTITGLNEGLNYNVHVFAYCGEGEISLPTTTTFTTNSNLICGDTFVDRWGTLGGYTYNQDYSVTICPPSPTERIQVIFSEFKTEPGYDILTVYDNDSAVGNPLGSYSGYNNGTNIPETITAENVSGCLTFNFTSNDDYNLSGWVATVNCIPAITCFEPSNLSVEILNNGDASIQWNNGNTETNWLIEYGLSDFSPGSGEQILTSDNPYIISGLSPGIYDVYLRSYCGIGDTSYSVGPVQLQLGLSCGNIFTDPGGLTTNYPNNTNDTTIMCPTLPNQAVLLSFNGNFHTEAGHDSLTIYNGNSTSDEIIASLQGLIIPENIYSTNQNGCLTTVFHSDEFVAESGWYATVYCVNQPSASIAEVENKNLIIFPNPSDGKFTISNQSGIKLEGELSDAQGRKLNFNALLINPKEEIILDLSNFESGLYFFKTLNNLGNYILIKY